MKILLTMKKIRPITMVCSFAIVIVCLCAFTGCEQEKFSFSLWGKKKPKPENVQQETESLEAQRSAPLPGTIGQRCYIQGLRSIFVQGYGMVAGLAETGSSQCPEGLRKNIMQTIAKYEKLYGPKGQRHLISSSAIIDSLDTAIVKVQGYIPAGALRGDRFDLFVSALPNTSTTSLEGGRLYTTELRVYAGNFGKVVTSKILAKGYGNIFINPFEKKKTPSSMIELKRSGYVLNGGVNLEERTLALILYQPSYALSRAIEQKINSVFGPPPERPLFKTARAVTPSKIELHIPYNYRHQRAHFLNIVKNLYIRNNPAYIQHQARLLAQEIVEPYANVNAISYAWEAMGRTILPLIQPIYNNSNLKAAFYSARAGARLGDSLAIERLAQFASKPKGRFRKEAITTLGFCHSYEARRVLRKLLDDSDIQIRILAYEGLSRLGDMSVDTTYVGEDNFRLDKVKSNGKKVVYVTRTGEPKVVLFGRIRIEPPVFYTSSNGRIIITANSNDKQLTIIRQAPSGKSSGKVSASLDLDELLVLLGSEPAVDRHSGKILGLGVTYSSIVSVLYSMCEDGSIPAGFKLQDITPELAVPSAPVGRPEK